MAPNASQNRDMCPMWETWIMRADGHPRFSRAIESVRNEWHEAPWFVILMIVIVAFVGPGLLWAAWAALTNLF